MAKARRRSRSAGQHNPEQTAILARRERAMAQIQTIRERGAASRFVANAEQLLTRWWSRTDWHGREELLNTAEWLLRIANGRGAAAATVFLQPGRGAATAPRAAPDEPEAAPR